ncbi:MAG: glutaredoxin family protein [Pseudomonadota bacterium]
MRLTLYGHEYCHLCHEMLEALAPMQRRYRFEVKWIDIEGCEELEARFGERVPVLMAGDEEICHHVLDPAAVLQRFNLSGKAL